MLVGAWSLALGARFSERERAALRAWVPEPRVEICQGPLWLCAPRDDVVTSDGRVLAYCGVLALGSGEPVELLRHHHPRDHHHVVDRVDRIRPDGHYALLDARPQDASLRFLRSLSGGEHIYFRGVEADAAVDADPAADVGVLVFATSARPLLATTARAPQLARDVVGPAIVNGVPLSGSRTLFAGLREVLPAHEAIVEAGAAPGSLRVRQRWAWPEALRSPTGAVDDLARAFRSALTEAVVLAAGRERPVALTLSGGIDSSAIAAAAVEAFGADAVRAYTYEFDDPEHKSPETPFARAVAVKLGIRHHEVFRIDERAFLDGVLEHVWRSESPAHWTKGFLLVVARHLRERGHTRHLTGFGVGSHMGWLAELEPVLPIARALLPLWRSARFGGGLSVAGLGMSRLHPGLEPPHPRLYHLLLRVLVGRELSSFFPPEVHSLLEGADDDVDVAGVSTRVRLERLAFAHLISCVDVTRSEKASREAGCLRMSPAHFAATLPYAYFPPSPRQRGADRHTRPGKLLLRRAYAGVLPDEVLYRKKSWDDAVASRMWRRRARLRMLRALPHFPHDFDVVDPAAVEAWEPESLLASGLAMRFFEELLVRRPPSPEPPRWSDLGSLDGQASASVVAGRSRDVHLR